MRGKGNFYAGAAGPAGFGRIADRIAGEVGADVAEGGAAGAIDEEAVERIADAATHGGEPIVSGQAASSAEARRRERAEAAGVGPIAVGFDAEHPGASLIIGPERAAEDEAGGVEIAARHPGHAVGPSAAAEDRKS